MPKNAFFLQTRDLLVSPKTMQRHFLFTLHPLSTVIFATATVLAFVLLHNSNFNFHCYTHYTAWSKAYSEIGPEMCCDLSRLLSRKITKRIHFSKPASLNRPIDQGPFQTLTLTELWHTAIILMMPSTITDAIPSISSNCVSNISYSVRLAVSLTRAGQLKHVSWQHLDETYIHLYVCVCVCTSMSVCICVCVCAQAWMCACMCVCGGG